MKALRLTSTFLPAFAICLTYGLAPVLADPPDDGCYPGSPFGNTNGICTYSADETLSGDLECLDLIIDEGVTLDMAGYTVRVCRTLLINSNGTITDNQSGGAGGPGGTGGRGQDPCADSGGPALPEDGTCGTNGLLPMRPEGGDGGPGGGAGGGGGGAILPAGQCYDADGGGGGNGGGGGHGGGYVRIYAFNFDNQGHIHADGEDGSPGVAGGSGEYWMDSKRDCKDLAGGGGGGGASGGGGHGGTVEVHYSNLTNRGAIHADGGIGGTGGAGGDSGTTVLGGPLVCEDFVIESSTNGADGCPFFPAGGNGGDGEHRRYHYAENGDGGMNGPDGLPGTVIDDPPQACCMGEWGCLDVDPSCCVLGGGTPLGAGTTCDTPEACCSNGVCHMTDPRCCSNGFVAMGPGSECLGDADSNGTDDACEMEACCLLDNTCIPAAPGTCPGVPQGPGTYCTEPRECWLDEGSRCEDIDPLCCVAIGGVPGDPGSTCLEACCLLSNVCTNALQTECGGISQGDGTYCTESQACWLDGGNECQDIDPLCCDDIGGTPGGPGTSCTQACCSNGVCTDLEPDDCEAQGGTPQGPGEACSALEACCSNGVCHMVDPLCCDDIGGERGGSTCAPTGACCRPDESCVTTTQVCCDFVGGTYHDGEACSAPEACCSNGVCHMVDPLCCDGTPQGEDTFCTAPRACCLGGGATCVEVDPLCCDEIGGEVAEYGYHCLGDSDGDGFDDACVEPPSAWSGDVVRSCDLSPTEKTPPGEAFVVVDPDPWTPLDGRRIWVPTATGTGAATPAGVVAWPGGGRQLTIRPLPDPDSENAVISLSGNTAAEESGGEERVAGVNLMDLIATDKLGIIPEGTPMPEAGRDGSRQCGSLVYENFYNGSGYYSGITSNGLARISDDCTLTGTDRYVCEIYTQVYNGGAAGDLIRVELWDACSHQGTPNRLFESGDIPLATGMNNLTVSVPYLEVIDTVWVAWVISSNEPEPLLVDAGPLISETAEIGSTGDVFGSEDCQGSPTCTCYFGGDPYAGLDAAIWAVDAVPGACCDTDDTCTNGLMPNECQPPRRFQPDTICDDGDGVWEPGEIRPLCGFGACCAGGGALCEEITEAACTGDWYDGEFCGEHSSPYGVHCPPINDNCADEARAVNPLPYTSVGRHNDGATQINCADLEAAVWEAFSFTGTDCQDVIIDLCGTTPPFLNYYLILLPTCDCTLTDDYVFSASSSTVDRYTGHSSCCLDDPPGYDANATIVWEDVAAGTYHYPVLASSELATWAWGEYQIHIRAVPCGFGTCGDYNGNGVTDLVDYNQFQICLEGSGPGAAYGTDCGLFDDDVDGDVDLADFWWFQQCFNGCYVCPPGGVPEGEDDICSQFDTRINDTCSNGEATDMTCGSIRCGTGGSFWLDCTEDGDCPDNDCDEVAGLCPGWAGRDIDWYEVTTTVPDTQITWRIKAEFPVEACMGVDPDCDSEWSIIPGFDAQTCDQVRLSMCATIPGTYYLAITSPFPWEADAPCGSAYTVEVICDELCPTHACCLPNETCVVATDYDCLFNTNGVPQIEDTCDGVDCTLGRPLVTGCPENSVFGHGLDDFSTAYTSDADEGYTVYDNFWGPATPAIDEITWWGLMISIFGGNCSTDDKHFNVVFYADGASPGPVTVDQGTRTPTITDSGEEFVTADSTFTIWEFNVNLPTPISQVGGWVSIQAAADSGFCTNYWLNNLDTDSGDELAYQNASALGEDMSMCLQAAGHEPPCGRDCPTNGVVIMEDEDYELITTCNMPGATWAGRSIAFANVDSNGGCAHPAVGDPPVAVENWKFALGVLDYGDDIVICGEGGYVGTNGVAIPPYTARDNDYYAFSLNETSLVTWSMDTDNADDLTVEGATVLIFDMANGCADTANMGSDSNVVATAGGDSPSGCGTVTVELTLEPGDYAAIARYGPHPDYLDPAYNQNFLPPCGTKYVAEMIVARPLNGLPSPTDECSNGVEAAGAGVWSGELNKTLYPGAYLPGESGYCEGGDPANDADVWWRYVAPCSGRVRIETCASALGTGDGGLLRIWEADDQVLPTCAKSEYTECYGRTGGATMDYLGHCSACVDDLQGYCADVKDGELLVEVVEGDTYFIQASMFGNQPGILTLEISECVDPCP